MFFSAKEAKYQSQLTYPGGPQAVFDLYDVILQSGRRFVEAGGNT